MSTKSKISLIHRALAPYRIDLFNYLYDNFDTDIYFEYPSALEQKFSTDILNQRIKFKYNILKKGFIFKNFRTQLFGLLRKEKYEYVFCSEFNLITLILIVFRIISFRKYKIVVISDENIDMLNKAFQKSMFSMQKLLYKFVDAIILCDKRSVDFYQNKSNKFKIHYLPIIQDDKYLKNIIINNIEQINIERKSILADDIDTAKILLYVGRLSKDKNAKYLLENISLHFSKKEIKTIIVGDGEEFNNLNAMLKDNNLEDRVILAGKKEGFELYKYYAIADIFVLPSSFEVFGAVVPEALSLGLSTFVSKNAGSMSIIENDKMGTIFDLDNPEKFRELLKKHINNSNHNTRKYDSLLPYSFDQYMSQLHSFITSI